MYLIRGVKIRHIVFISVSLFILYVLYNSVHRTLNSFVPLPNHPSLLLHPEPPEHVEERKSYVFPVEQESYQLNVDRSKQSQINLKFNGRVHESVNLKGPLLGDVQNPNVNPRKISSLFNDDDEFPFDELAINDKEETFRRRRVDALRILRQLSNTSLTNVNVDPLNLLRALRPLVSSPPSHSFIHSPLNHQFQSTVARGANVSVDRFWPDKELPELLDWRREMTQSTITLPADVGQRPFIGNGHIGMMAFDETIRLRGLYFGIGSQSKLVSIPASIVVNITEAQIITAPSKSSEEPLTVSLGITRMFHHSLPEAASSQWLLLDEIPSSSSLEDFQESVHHFGVAQRIYAHWRIRQLLIHEIEVVTLRNLTSSTSNSTLVLHLKPLAPKYPDDMTMRPVAREPILNSSSLRRYKDIIHKYGVLHSSESPQEDSLTFHVIQSPIPEKLYIPLQGGSGTRRKFTFLMSVDMDHNVAWEQFVFGVNLVEKGDLLYGSHIDACKRQWSASAGTLMLRGDRQLSRASLWAQYTLLTNLPTPGSQRATGLSSLGLMRSQTSMLEDGEKHHVTWGQEAWLQPWLTLMQPASSLELLRYRLQTMSSADGNAASLGFQEGQCLFAMESTHSGRELYSHEKTNHESTSSRHTRLDEVNGFVALSLQQFLLAHNKTTFTIVGESFIPSDVKTTLWDEHSFYSSEPIFQFGRTGRVMLEKIARWFTARLVRRIEPAVMATNVTLYDIFELWPHSDDASSTAGVRLRNPLLLVGMAKLSLEAPLVLKEYLSGRAPLSSLAENKDMELQLKQNPYLWNARLAEQINIPQRVKQLTKRHVNSLEIHPQYEDYQINLPISLTEAAFLAHPLDLRSFHDLEKLARDLNYYEKVLDDTASCMNYGIHSILWIELQKWTDAWDTFTQQLRHCYIKSVHTYPVWQELPVRKNLPELIPKHVTPSLYPAGAFLQTLFYGYFGVRLRPSGLYFHPVLPPKIWWIYLRGVNYLGCVLDIDFGIPSRRERQGQAQERIGSRNAMQLRVKLRSFQKDGQQLLLKSLSSFSQRPLTFRGVVDEEFILDYLSAESSRFVLRSTGSQWETTGKSTQNRKKVWKNESKFNKIKLASRSLSRVVIASVVDFRPKKVSDLDKNKSSKLLVTQQKKKKSVEELVAEADAIG